MEDKNIYQFKTTDLAGNTFDFSSLKGKKMMIVNTASQCGLTPQFEGLEAIYKEYQSKGFTIIGFPQMILQGRSRVQMRRLLLFVSAIIVLPFL